jgi:hypothetical protein
MCGQVLSSFLPRLRCLLTRPSLYAECRRILKPALLEPFFFHPRCTSMHSPHKAPALSGNDRLYQEAQVLPSHSPPSHNARPRNISSRPRPRQYTRRLLAHKMHCKSGVQPWVGQESAARRTSAARLYVMRIAGCTMPGRGQRRDPS